MLVITRKPGQRVFLGGDISVTVNRVFPDGRVRLGIQAPPDVIVAREELLSAQGGAPCLGSERSNSPSSPPSP